MSAPRRMEGPLRTRNSFVEEVTEALEVNRNLSGIRDGKDIGVEVAEWKKHKQ